MTAAWQAAVYIASLGTRQIYNLVFHLSLIFGLPQAEALECSV